jgi:hypothetical protein
MRWRLGVVLGTFVGALGCGHVSPVRPTPQHELHLEADFGGPVASWGFPFPAPHATVGASYGLTDRLDAKVHLQMTPLLAGVAGVDVGSTYLVFQEHPPLPALSVTGRLYGFTDFVNSAAYAEATATASYLIRERLLPYVSFTAFGQFAGGRVILSPSAGALYWFDRVGLQAEVRWYQPGVPTERAVVPWVGPGGQGALGFVLGVRWRLEGEDR